MQPTHSFEVAIFDLFIAFGVTSGFAQKECYIKYNLLVDQVRTCLAKKDFATAVPLFEFTFTYVQWSHYAYMDAIRSAIRAEKFEKANDFLIADALNGVDPAN